MREFDTQPREVLLAFDEYCQKIVVSGSFGISKNCVTKPCGTSFEMLYKIHCLVYGRMGGNSHSEKLMKTKLNCRS